MVDCVVIENDKKERVLRKKLVKDITSYTKDEYVELLKNCAVTGMGGSDFPTYLKYNNKLDILIVNAVVVSLCPFVSMYNTGLFLQYKYRFVPRIPLFICISAFINRPVSGS